MSVVYRDLTIDCTKDNYKSEKVTGYEHGVKVFRFKPLNGNIPIDLSDCTGAAYVGTKSDGKIIGNTCEIKDSKILLPLSLQMTTARGDLKGHIEAYYPNGTLKFFGVDFEVYPSPETAEIESKDEFTLLETAIAQAKNAYQIAVDNGFVGTESDWLESLKGEKGADGINGKDGADGANGIDGTNGIDGKDGIGITNADINSNGELVLTYSDNTVSNLGVVVGADGKDGQDGVNGADGSGYVLTEEDKTEIANAALEDINTTLSGKADKATTLEGYGITDTYSKTETNNALANKADLVQSKNIFDFDKWAECLQSLSLPVYNGTLDEIDFDEKSITFTGTAAGSYTRNWLKNSPDEAKITVKPNTAYMFSWKITSSSSTKMILYFNAEDTAETRLSIDGKTGYITFTTLEDTSYITIRFGNLETGTVTVSDIMIEEGEEKSLYLPYEVAEGVKELAQSTEIALAEIRAQVQKILKNESEV